MAKCSKAGINTPTLYLIDNTNHVIYMEFIEGITVKEFLRKNQDKVESKNKINGMIFYFYFIYLIILFGFCPYC